MAHLSVRGYHYICKNLMKPHSGYKLETIASRVDRLIFPSLWDKIFLPEHLIGGFRGADIHPLDNGNGPPSLMLEVWNSGRETGNLFGVA